MRALLAAALAALALSMPASARMPELTGRVVDDAGILSAEARLGLTVELEALEEKNGRQVVVVTVPGLEGQDIETFSLDLANRWAIGSDKQDGLVFLVAPNERQARIEVGCGLEDIVTDAFAHKILEQEGLSRFRQGDLEGGVVATTEALIGQLARPDDEARAIALAAGPPNDPPTAEQQRLCGRTP